MIQIHAIIEKIMVFKQLRIIIEIILVIAETVLLLADESEIIDVTNVNHDTHGTIIHV